jgi:hypothetical protein
MRYLDEDVLYSIVEEKYKIAKGEARAAYSDVLDTICEMPRADVKPRADWISVREMLPERMKPVLVLATSRREDDGFDVLIAYYDRGDWDERSVHGDGGTVYAHVTHWMPLPEPPKGE